MITNTNQIDPTIRTEQIGTITKIMGNIIPVAKKTSSVAQWGFGMLKDATVGATLWFAARYMSGEKYVFHNLNWILFNPELLRYDKYALKANADHLVALLKSRGSVVQDIVNTESILSSPCPKKEYLSQLSYILQQKVRELSIFEKCMSPIAINSVVINPVSEEVIFRELLQTRVLKDLVEKIIRKVSPQHASLVDTKIYTACRILITTICFVVLHDMSREGAPCDCQVDAEHQLAILSGIVLGLLRENFGLASSIGASVFHNFIAMSPELFSQC